MTPDEQPDCLRRLRAMSSEEGFDDYSDDEWVNTSREVIAAFEELHAETVSLRDQRDRLAQANAELGVATVKALAERDDLRAIVEGRTTAPTLAEIAAHSGEWLVDGCVVGFYFYDDHDQHLRLCVGNATLSDRAARAWLAESASECCRWIALDSEGRPCAWPVVTP